MNENPLPHPNLSWPPALAPVLVKLVRIVNIASGAPKTVKPAAFVSDRYEIKVILSCKLNEEILFVHSTTAFSPVPSAT
jgi:hypothetical protein